MPILPPKFWLPCSKLVTQITGKSFILTYILTYLHTYIHTYIQTYIHTYRHTYRHTDIHTYTHTHIHTYTHTHIHTYTHTHIHTYATTVGVSSSICHFSRKIKQLGICKNSFIYRCNIVFQQSINRCWYSQLDFNNGKRCFFKKSTAFFAIPNTITPRRLY